MEGVNTLVDRAGLYVALQDFVSVDEALSARTVVPPLLKAKIGNFRPSKAEMMDTEAIYRIVFLSNLIDGPVILKVPEKGGGYGLFAHKRLEHRQGDIKDGNLITKYDGVLVDEYAPEGDYLMSNTSTRQEMDGLYGFALKNKGRWMNDDPINFNARLKANWDIRVRRARTIETGEEILINYGEQYHRPWLKADLSQCSICKVEAAVYVCNTCNQRFCSLTCSSRKK